ncbi:MAG: discoidin domain-containing protein [Thermomicrobiales bacterium]
MLLRRWRPVLIFVTVVMLAGSLGAGALLGFGSTAVGMRQMNHGDSAPAGTPLAATAEPSDQNGGDPLDGDPLDGDPLDGDPLDGEPPLGDPAVPADHTQLEIVRSGRPNAEPRTLPAYDADPETIWTPEPDADETWLWLDLGEERRVREVRWLAEGAGAIEVSLSSDRRRWQDVDQVDVGDSWQGVSLRDDARYVRLSLQSAVGELPSIAEVAVYGSDRRSMSAEQEADEDGRQRRRDRAERDNGDSRSRRGSEEDRPAEDRDSDRPRDRRSTGRVRISAQRGETRCAGNRERCEAREGEAYIEDDCEQEGSCTIDVRVDGGTAICDATGGEDARAGDGEGKRSGDGGRCDATADGGAVTIGDIGP